MANDTQPVDVQIRLFLADLLERAEHAPPVLTGDTLHHTVALTAHDVARLRRFTGGFKAAHAQVHP